MYQYYALTTTWFGLNVPQRYISKLDHVYRLFFFILFPCALDLASLHLFRSGCRYAVRALVRPHKRALGENLLRACAALERVRIM